MKTLYDCIVLAAEKAGFDGKYFVDFLVDTMNAQLKDIPGYDTTVAYDNMLEWIFDADRPDKNDDNNDCYYYYSQATMHRNGEDWIIHAVIDYIAYRLDIDTKKIEYNTDNCYSLMEQYFKN